MAGKGDKPRPYNKTKFNNNYEQISWTKKSRKLFIPTQKDLGRNE
jgi:hypothetical protein